jgi:maleylacetate reductase
VLQAVAPASAADQVAAGQAHDKPAEEEGMKVGQYTPPNQQTIVYGRPVAEALPEALRAANLTSVALVTTRSLTKPGGLAEQVAPILGSACVGIFSQIQAHTPRSDVVRLAAFLRDRGVDGIVSIGGGSVCDAVKIARILLSNGVEDIQGMDRLRAPAAVEAPGLPYFCIPTTLSAGEYTPYAGSTDERRPLKEAYFHPRLAAEMVILDPAMSLNTPHDLWFSTGIRAVDHAVEAWCAKNTTPMADAASLHALRLLFGALQRSMEEPASLEARLDSQIGAWLSIQGFVGGADLGGSHAIGHALGGTAGMGHGHTSCVLLPHVLRYNASVNGQRQKAISEVVGQPDHSAADLVQDLVARLRLPGRLRDAGISRDILEAVSAAAMHDPWIATNPRPIDTPETVLAILEQSW